MDVLITGLDSSNISTSYLWKNISSTSAFAVNNSPLPVIYPNPTNGQFPIAFETTLSELTINLEDLQGKLISTSTHKNTNRINLEIQQPTGVYFAKITTPKGTNHKID